MIVNLAETRDRLAKSGRKIAPYAVAKGLNPETLRKFFNGQLPPSEGPVYPKIVEALESDGLLVTEDEE